jgi:hypothetical protein
LRSQWLAGVRGRRQGQRETLAAQLGSDHFDPILDEPNLVLPSLTETDT